MRFFLAVVLLGAACALAQPSTHQMAEQVTGSMLKLRAMKTEAYPAGQNEFTIQVGSMQRTYYVWVPKSYTGEVAVPVVFAFHGLGDDCLNFGPAVGFSTFAEQRNFLYVYPCSTTGILGNCWNAGVCCCEGNGADDIAFTRSMLQQIQSNFNVNATRVYATGFSNGAFMAEILGCVAPDIIKATASVSGVVELSPGNSGGLTTCTTDYQNFTQRVSTVNIHGNLDFVVPWTGDALLGFPAIPDNFAAWGQRNGCVGDPVQTFSNGTFSNKIYQNCQDNTVVEVVENNGGGHEWPSTSDFDTTTFIVNFFNL